MLGLEAGQRSIFRRTSPADVKSFVAVSGDGGTHHMRPGANGKVTIQRLLTATLPTRLGCDVNYIARQKVFGSPSPVFVGGTITYEGTVSRVLREVGGLKPSTSVVCVNQHGKEVSLGTTEGIIRLDEGRSQER